MDKKPPNRLVVHMEGATEDHGDVRLSEFLEQLQAIKGVLATLSPKEPGTRVSYRVVELSHNSPAMVALEPLVEEMIPDGESGKVARKKFRVIAGGLDTPREMVTRLSEINAAQKPPRYLRRVSDMEPYVDLAMPLRKHVMRVTFEFGDTKVELDRRFPEHIDSLMGQDSHEMGEISGNLDTVSVHGSRKFAIFPIVGPRRVACHFNESLFEQVRAALRKFVTVSGVVRFKSWDRLPYRIDVREIVVHEEPKSPVSLSDLVGIAPGIDLEQRRGEDDW